MNMSVSTMPSFQVSVLAKEAKFQSSEEEAETSMENNCLSRSKATFW